MSDLGEPYLSYLLRLWMVQNQEGNVWRCSVEDVQTGERYGFASLESLCDFLREATGRPLDTAQEDSWSHEN